jgi:hypothetical protein
MNETFTVAAGGKFDDYGPHGFSYIYGVWVDNFTGGWISIGNNSGLWVPPYTRGWQAVIFPGTTSLSVGSYDFANGTPITGATGTSYNVTIWDEPSGSADGIAFFDEQTVPTPYVNGFVLPSAGTVILGGPAVGRYRIYQISVSYSGPSIPNSDWQPDGVKFVFSDNLGNGYASLEISPASPIDRVALLAPQGDLPIGGSLIMSAQSVEKALAGADTAVRVFFSYAVI